MFPYEEVLTLVSIINNKAFQGMEGERCSEIHVHRESGAVSFVHLIDNKLVSFPVNITKIFEQTLKQYLLK